MKIEILAPAILFALSGAWLFFALVKKEPPSAAPVEVGVANLVEAVKSEILQAEQQANMNPERVLKLDKAEVEVTFMVKTSSKATAGASPELIAVSTETEVANERTHKVVLSLSPKRTSDRETEPNSTNPPGGRVNTVGDEPGTRRR